MGRDTVTFAPPLALAGGSGGGGKTLTQQACDNARANLCAQLDDNFFSAQSKFNGALGRARGYQAKVVNESDNLGAAGCGKFGTPTLKLI